MERLTRKRVVSVLVAVPALLLLLAATRTWLIGRSADPLLGGGAVAATGSQLAPGVVALAVVAVVALVASLTGGPRIRRLSAVVTLLAAVGSMVLTLRPLSDPEDALGRVAAGALGRTGVVGTTAVATGWAGLAVGGATLLVVAALVLVVAVGRWAGLSTRFEAPGETAPAGRGVRRSAWDAVSEGRDPTVPPAPADEGRPT